MGTFESLSQDIKQQPLRMLSENLNERDEITKAYTDSPEHWWVGYHFYWGMGIRNLLRTSGFAEQYFGVGNLDDIYVQLVEEALGLG